MPRSIIALPPSVTGDYTVYLNGVAQEEDADFRVEGRTLVFDRSLRKDRISGWRWFLGAPARTGSLDPRNDDGPPNGGPSVLRRTGGFRGSARPAPS
ncbi:MAG: hypothetical protein ACSLFR_14160 [Solirubrobacteraceae bacterium]